MISSYAQLSAFASTVYNLKRFITLVQCVAGRIMLAYRYLAFKELRYFNFSHPIFGNFFGELVSQVNQS